MKAVSKIVKNEKEVKPIEFPVLMQSEATGIVILFTSPKVGTILVGNDAHDIGEYGDDWSDASRHPWKPFECKITIGNE